MTGIVYSFCDKGLVKESMNEWATGVKLLAVYNNDKIYQFLKNTKYDFTKDVSWHLIFD